MNDRVPIAHVEILPEDIVAVTRVLESRQLRQGRLVQQFEEAFAYTVGARHAVAVSSGTAALHLAYLALFRPGDEILVPSFTFVATASMLLAVGAVPVFVDVDPRTFTISTEGLASVVTEWTRGLAGVHLFGNSCDVDSVVRLATDHRLTLVWDAAQALGTEYRGSPIGNLPTATCYSFYATKNITTGEGGMITTDDDDLASRLRLSRSQGAEAKYLHTSLGFNYRMTELQAALGLTQLGRLDVYLERRREHARQLDARLAFPGISVPAVTTFCTHSYNQYAVLVDESLTGISRDQLRRDLSSKGVETAIHYPRPVHQQPLFDNGPRNLPIATSLCNEILCLPVHPGLSSSSLAQIGDAVASSLGSTRVRRERE